MKEFFTAAEIAAATSNKSLNSVDRLPDSEIASVQWAWDRLRERRMTQTEICQSLNLRLTENGLAPISFAAFNRWAKKVIIGTAKRPMLIGRATAPSLPIDIASDETRRLFAMALRSLADDIEKGGR